MLHHLVRLRVVTVGGFWLLALVGCGQGPTSTAEGDSAQTTAVAHTEAQDCPAGCCTESAGETHQVNIKVPSMHCPFGCFPSVQETLAGLPGVKKVELVPQAEEGKINDPRVTVTYQGEFDSKAAVAALATASFPGAGIDGQ